MKSNIKNAKKSITLNEDEVIKKVETQYKELKIRHYRSIKIFTGINILVYLLASIIVVLNIFAIRKNPANEEFTKWLFVTVTILATLSGFVNSIISLYVFRKRNKAIVEKLHRIQQEKLEYKQKSDDYEESKNPEELLIKNISDILNG